MAYGLLPSATVGVKRLLTYHLNKNIHLKPNLLSQPRFTGLY